MMYRTSLLLLFLLASGVAAGAGAQEPPHAAAPARVADLRRMQPVSGDARAGAGKAAVCAACHGAQGVAIAPNFPNLAGQSATYLYVQLKEFHDGLRSDPVMSGQAAALSDADMRDLASYYAALAPKPAGRADAASRGAQLYLAGDPAKGIPPCQGCHGADALGPRPHPSSAPPPPWASWPRLRGQSALYLAKELADFKSGARSGTSNAKVMQGVVETLDAADVQALSAYLDAL
ncbi:cytochrome C [Rhodanobacter sp. FW510-R12]|uniref:c-type cytochrome n=1 Tax=unclassified Rhodanobacter TaxID=2621553 RepID=UPI0007A9DD3E|nr:MULTISPECIES: cytochrome c4 [unclassified Rhodanobacter]KZC17593.1 cytochrome C [Rhodanobacter sp. FW104-R8]KZC25458.1 cytochrome C [Rhodanobacter sp. FW510-T8]KZC32252.1 cytochrome C [Rhodanobacter sp. FW510-R10]